MMQWYLSILQSGGSAFQDASQLDLPSFFLFKPHIDIYLHASKHNLSAAFDSRVFHHVSFTFTVTNPRSSGQTDTETNHSSTTASHTTTTVSHNPTCPAIYDVEYRRIQRCAFGLHIG